MANIKNQKKKKIVSIPFWKYLLLIPLSWIVKLWWLTLKIKVSEESLERIQYAEKPLIVILWHNRLFVVAFLNWYFRRNKKPFYGLISASKDGAWLEAFFRVFGIKSVRGSSSFRGEHALKDLLKAIKRGHPIAITPDGPKGPCYSFKSGFLSLAKLSQVPLMLFSCKCSNAWRINSWDGLFLPKPFSTIEMEILLYNEIDFSLSYEELSEELKDNLLAITED